MKSRLIIDRGASQDEVTVEDAGARRYRVTVGAERLELDARRIGAGEYHLLWGLESHDLLLERRGDATVVHRSLDGGALSVTLIDELAATRAALASARVGGARGSNGSVAIRAPMPGKVVKARVRPGEAVSAGQGVIVIEAMKMENELRAPVEGKVREIRVVEGANVEAGEQLVLIE
jgi:biotin carboxyl carrier protein